LKKTEVYMPREDSLMLAEEVKKFSFGRVLDMGTGSGIQACTAFHLPKVKEVIAVDINPKAIEHCKKEWTKHKITFKVSDLFEKVSGKFDTILFNPPYLPEDHKVYDVALEGGKKGHETLQRFVEDVSEYLKPNGIILLVFSSLTRKSKVDEMLQDNLFDFKLLHKTRIFFEELYTYKVTKSDLLKRLEKKGCKNISYHAKGKRGLVYKAKYQGKNAAIKVKRPSSRAQGRLENEARILKLVNKKKIGPLLWYAEKDFLITEFIEGPSMVKWLPKAPKIQRGNVLKQVLEQCFVMDQMKISKEEMTRPLKHVIISKKGPRMIDFERSHMTENPQNVTQFCTFLRNRNYVTGNKKRTLLELAKEYKITYSKHIINEIKKLW